mmetsp:Transcript_5002/g.11047  ORF Transcript_5002/g.11047 Transcript_5002/m.11047 type:complete len:244 (+) Transcript_5002:397-1128(+)
MTAPLEESSLLGLRALSPNDPALLLLLHCASLRELHPRPGEEPPWSRMSLHVKYLHHSLTAVTLWMLSEALPQLPVIFGSWIPDRRRTVPTKAAQGKPSPLVSRSPLPLALSWFPPPSNSSRSPRRNGYASPSRSRRRSRMSRAGIHLRRCLLRVSCPGNQLFPPCPSGSATPPCSLPWMPCCRSGRTCARKLLNEIVRNWLPGLFSKGACSWSRETCISSRLWRTTRRCTNSGRGRMDRSRW